MIVGKFCVIEHFFIQHPMHRLLSFFAFRQFFAFSRLQIIAGLGRGNDVALSFEQGDKLSPT